jgi:hypothetical protein
VVYVTDANGVAVSGVTLTIKAIPTHYLRGNLTQGRGLLGLPADDPDLPDRGRQRERRARS